MFFAGMALEGGLNGGVGYNLIRYFQNLSYSDSKVIVKA